MVQVAGLDFSCAVDARAELVNASVINVEADYRRSGARERNGNR
jgi:hypothetical protein